MDLPASVIICDLPDSLRLLDPHDREAPWRVVECNGAACRLFGATREQLIGTAADDIPAALAELSVRGDTITHLRQSGVERVEITYRTPTGAERVIESSLALITLDGRELVAAVDRDITGRRNVEGELRRRAAINRCAAAIARQLDALSVEDLDFGINQALATVGAFLGINRTCIWVLGADRGALGIAHEWRADGGRAVHASIPLASVPWLAERVKRRQLIHVPDIAALPPEALAERATLSAYGARALLAVPIVGDVTALLSCESLQEPRRWTSDEIGLLLQVAEILGRALDRQRAVLDFHSTQARYRVLTDHTTDVISLHDEHGAFTYCSPAARAMLGYEPAALIGRSPADLVHPEDLPDILLRGKVHDTGAVTTVYRLRHHDGYYLWVETSARTVCDPQTGVVREIVAVTRDVDARKSYEARIEQLAFYDPLTGLANRRFLYDRMHRTLNGAGPAGTTTALLYLDLDRFKTVNDTLGHDAGDELLVQVASRLRAQLRPSDILSRLGGDEFAVLLPDLPDHELAVGLARRILEQIQLPFDIRGHTIHIGVSIGIALAPENSARPEDMLKHADIAMYRAKLEGDTYRFYEPSLNPYLHQRLILEDSLRAALAADTLTLHFQPICDVAAQQVYAVEALVRWPQPDGGFRMPGDFVPLAEETSLIHTLDRWVIRRALGQLREWGDQGWCGSMSINLSPRTLHDRTLVEYFSSWLHHSGVPAERVVIEVTESAVMRDPETVKSVLLRLRQLGVRVALDDFGSGYAALNYIKQLPIDIIKVDRSFIQGIGRDARDEGILRAIITIGRAMGCTIIAEGVRDESQIAWLRAAGCHHVQGYGVGAPQPPGEFLDHARAVEAVVR